MSADQSEPPTLVEYYRRILQLKLSSNRGLENVCEPSIASGPDLSDGGIRERVSASEAELRRMIKEYLGDKPELYEIASRLCAAGDEALRKLRDNDEQSLSKDANLRMGIEVIVRTDGTRPSFLIRNGEVDQSTSPVGSWGAILDDRAEQLNKAISCVGRIDVPSSKLGYEGTGFLIHVNRPGF